jgi:hypothetical protein
MALNLALNITATATDTTLSGNNSAVGFLELIDTATYTYVDVRQFTLTTGAAALNVWPTGNFTSYLNFLIVVQNYASTTNAYVTAVIDADTERFGKVGAFQANTSLTLQSGHGNDVRIIVVAYQ